MLVVNLQYLFLFQDIETHDVVIVKNFGVILDKMKINNKANFIGFIYSKFNEGRSK